MKSLTSLFAQFVEKIFWQVIFFFQRDPENKIFIERSISVLADSLLEKNQAVFYQNQILKAHSVGQVNFLDFEE